MRCGGRGEEQYFGVRRSIELGDDFSSLAEAGTEGEAKNNKKEQKSLVEISYSKYMITG